MTAAAEDGGGGGGGGVVLLQEGGVRGRLSGLTYYCRGRPRRVLVMVVVLLLFGQFVLNMLFYRSSATLFFVNTTTTSHGSLLFDSRLWWKSSQLPWLQPVVSSLKTESPSSPISINNYKSKSNNEHKATGGRRTSSSSSNITLNSKQGIMALGKESLNDEIIAAFPSLSRNSSIVNVKNSSVTVREREEGRKEGNRRLQMGATKPADKPLCPPVPPKLVGVVRVNRSAPSLEEQERGHPELAPGGHYLPPDCRARHRVAVIIPYRDRVYHLSVLLNHLHPILQRQQVDYTIFVVEQKGSGKFNRAMLMNVGALEAVKHYPFQCFIFHDVDLLMEDDRNLYTCPEQPRHMSIAINSMKYRLPYNDIFGGVSAMTTEQFKTVNGFSNKFWGWGGEDDDMSNRIKYHGFFISRYPANVARYTMLSHKKDNPNPRRYQYLHEGKKRYISDGLNSVKYRLLDTQLRRLYTWLYVDLFPS